MPKPLLPYKLGYLNSKHYKTPHHGAVLTIVKIFAKYLILNVIISNNKLQSFSFTSFAETRFDFIKTSFSGSLKYFKISVIARLDDSQVVAIF